MRYDGTPGEDAVVYELGWGVSIDGIYGDISVVEGVPGEIAVVYEPFAYAGSGEAGEAAEAIEEKARFPNLFLDDETLVVRSGRTDGELPLVGMDLQIALPPEFDGPISIRNRGSGTWNPGEVDVRFVGFAPSVAVTAGPLGDCTITGGPEVYFTRARCGDSVRVYGVNDTVDLRSTGGFGDVVLELATVSPFAGESVVHSETGEVDVTFPFYADFSFTAQATDPGVVDLGAVETECETAIAAESAKSATCGAGGPLYTLRSDAGGVYVDLR